MQLKTVLDLANDIAHAAGNVLRQGFGNDVTIDRKSSATDWVTQYDWAAERLILERLRVAFPDHGVVAEESGQFVSDSDFAWYIDPLDGTNNFAHGLPHFCVSLALYRGAQPQVGVIYDPLRDECFCAARGQGAVLRHNGKTHSLSVSKTTRLDASLIATGYPYDKHVSAQNNLAETAVFVTRVQGLRRSGSAALDLAYVAAGRLDGYWEYKLHSWDVAAGVLLLTEAGGRVTQIDGRPFAIAPRVALIASNGRIHTPMQATLAEAAPASSAE